MEHISAVHPFLELHDISYAKGEPINAVTLTANGVAAKRGVLGAAIPVEGAESVDYACMGGRVVLAGTKGFKAIPDFVSDKVVMKELSIQGAIGVTSSGYRKAIELIERRTSPIAKMHTHDFALEDAELAIRTLARDVPGEESIHSTLVPPS